MDTEKAKNKKMKAEMEISHILDNLEKETGLRANIVYVYREGAKSELAVQPIERIKAEIILILQ
jgi:tRNA G26 N,N-dimethylase Trm1